MIGFAVQLESCIINAICITADDAAEVIVPLCCSVLMSCIKTENNVPLDSMLIGDEEVGDRCAIGNKLSSEVGGTEDVFSGLIGWEVRMRNR